MAESFISDHEHILLMDMPNAMYFGYEPRPMTLDDLKKCKDAGIDTAFQFHWWQMSEPTQGNYDWSLVDEGVNRVLKAGMKLLLFQYEYPPQTFPDDWYFIQSNGIRASHLSIWNKEAQDYEHQYLRLLRQRYPVDKVQFANSMICDGETMMPGYPTYFGEHAKRSFQEHYGTDAIPADDPQTYTWYKKSVIQSIIEHHNIFLENSNFRDIWGAYHKVILTRWAGGDFIDELYQAYHDTYANTVNINVIQFTYMPHGHQFWERIKADIGKYHLKVWGGAEYCEGLPTATPVAKQYDLRGLLIAPIHYFTQHKTMEQWMVDNIINSMKVFNE